MQQRSQCTDSILMIRPKHFGYNELTASSNFFQHKNNLLNLNLIAQNEFDKSVELLRAQGIDIFIFDDVDEAITPDSIFPNNWVSFMHSGAACVFSMEAENRRKEKRVDIIASLKSNFEINSIDDYSYYEQAEKYLEGTGSIVFDHTNAIAYAALSSRTNIEALKSFCIKHDYSSITFHSTDKNHQPVYHTNVMMCVGEKFCILCSKSIQNKSELKHLFKQLEDNEKEIIDISLEQMHQFAGNMIQLKNKTGLCFIACSQTAYNALTENQIVRLKQHGSFIICPVETIENVGGGSIRCMIAEIFSRKIPRPS